MVTFKVSNLKNMNAELRTFADFLRSADVEDDEVFASRLVSCELITNVIRHGGEIAFFTGEISDDKISITVTARSLCGLDLNPTLPDVFAENGRGLYIVKSIGDIEECDGGLRVYIKRKRR